MFRAFKSELGLRSVYHQAPRAEGYQFITVQASQAVQLIRQRLLARGYTDSWPTLRNLLGIQQRLTATFRCADGRTLHLRKVTRSEAEQQTIDDKLDID